MIKVLEKFNNNNYFNESNNIKSSNIHKCDEYTVAIAKKKFAYFSKGSLVYYFIDDVTIFCYLTNNPETWICNLDIDKKDEYLRDMTDDEYNKLCQIGKSSTSTYQGSEDQKKYRLSLVEEGVENMIKVESENIYKTDLKENITTDPSIDDLVSNLKKHGARIRVLKVSNNKIFVPKHDLAIASDYARSYEEYYGLDKGTYKIVSQM